MKVNKVLKAKIVSIGAWGQEFHQWQDLALLLQNKKTEVEPLKSPKPEIIPANERRRAPLPVRLAVETSWQAVQQSSFKANEMSCVFVSALGDTQLTDYMCKVLAGENKQLSPTKFHNSVHNAAAGYWTISTGCMKAANSVAAYNESVSMTLLEALTQIAVEQEPILLSFYDAPVSPVLKSLLKNEFPFSVSLVLAPSSSDIDGVNVCANFSNEIVNWGTLGVENKNLNSLYQSTPTAKVLTLLKSLALLGSQKQEQLVMPLSTQSSIQLTLG